MLVALFIYRELDWPTMQRVLRESVGITSMIFLIIPAAMVFAMYLTSEQVPQHVAQWVVDRHLGANGFWIVVMSMFFVMGTFLDAVAIDKGRRYGYMRHSEQEPASPVTENADDDSVNAAVPRLTTTPASDCWKRA